MHEFYAEDWHNKQWISQLNIKLSLPSSDLKYQFYWLITNTSTYPVIILEPVAFQPVCYMIPAPFMWQIFMRMPYSS